MTKQEDTKGIKNNKWINIPDIWLIPRSQPGHIANFLPEIYLTKEINPMLSLSRKSRFLSVSQYFFRETVPLKL